MPARYVLDVPYKAGGAIARFGPVKLSGTDGDTVVACTADNEAAIGFCQETVTADDATAGRVVGVRVSGESYVVVNADLAAGDYIRSSSDAGKVEGLAAATANQNSLGRLKTNPAANGDWAIASVVLEQRST
jgi:hypothetical protein